MASTTEHLDVRREILRAIEEKDISWSKAHKELGVARQSLYSWCGPHSAVPPDPSHAREIADFIGRPYEEVLSELIRRRTERYFSGNSKDFQVEVRIKDGKGRVLGRSGFDDSDTGDVPGYISSAGRNASPSSHQPHLANPPTCPACALNLDGRSPQWDGELS